MSAKLIDNYLFLSFVFEELIYSFPMQYKNFLRSSMPHLVAVIVFLTITLVYFYPVLEGKVLHTNDGTVAQSASKEIRDYRDKYGDEPLWTNSMFSGMPAYLISTRFPGNLMRYADRVLRTIKQPVSTIFLTMLGFYILLLIFNVRPWLAIAGAIAYGLSTYFFFIIAAGHNTKAVAIAYMAPMIGSVYYTYRYNVFKGIILTAFFLSLEIIANHPQITYYSFICILILVITEFIWSLKQKEVMNFVKRSALLSIPVILAVGMNFASLSTTNEYGKYSTRGKSELISDDKNMTSGLDRDYITDWSYGIDETLTLLIPNFKGGANIPFDRNSETVTTLIKNNAGQYANQFYRYWGTQRWTDGPVYVGAIVVFLFIFGLVIIKGPVKWWLLAATILSIMLAWGKNFMPLTNLFLDYFPGYSKFRAVTMTLVIAEFCMPLLAILALRDIIDGTITKKKFMKGLKIAFGITGGLTFLFILFPGISGSFISPAEQGNSFPDWLTSALVRDREGMLRGDALRSLIFIALGAGTLLALHYEKIKKEYAIVLLGFLFLFDMFLVDKRYMNSSKFVTPSVARKAIQPSPADSKILEDKSIFRVLNLAVSPFNDASTSQFHQSIGGYHGAKLRRYQDLIDSVIMKDYIVFYSAINTAKTLEDLRPALNKLNGNNALKMLNAKYFIIMPEMDPIVNNMALGNSWFVDTLIFAGNANQELSLVNKIDPARLAVADIRFKEKIKNSSFPGGETDSIRLVSYKPNKLIYKTDSEADRLAVFSEIYYPEGWKAYIDGKESDHVRVNYLLRGMVIPAGEHEIRFSFKPESYFIGNKISYASSAIFLLMAAGYAVWSFTRRKKNPENDIAQ
jgi:hypothetical protein